ncbi:HIT domain-containing protein [Candidatus Woesearchaeota archaeon]|nr:HIT domain-containing protein [Candidatus Woesearchaeota archaeon]
MTETCVFCQAVKGQAKVERIYEDDKILAILHPRPASKGHVLVFSKKHYNILEQIPDFELGDLFKKLNKISIAAFEGVKAQGTNIIIQNGVAAGQEIPHVCVHIIPRNENDGLNFQWQPKQLTEEEMSTVELTLKKEAEGIGSFQKEEKKEPVKLDKKAEKLKDDEENYLIKKLTRIP